MATITLMGSSAGNALQSLLVAQDIRAGDAPSYETCKTLYLYHPLGAKMAEAPTRIAQSQKREISVPGAPGERLVEEFEKEWRRLRADVVIFNTMRISRVYGISTLALLVSGESGELEDSSKPIDLEALRSKAVAFNVLDPLNTAGSLVLSQIPTAFDFQKAVDGVASQGVRWHTTRCVVVPNEEPIYIAFTTSAFGFVGRSVYQRALLPMKTFVQTMVTDDMVSLKAGVLVAKLKQAGSIVSQTMQAMFGLKRNVVKEAAVGNVISISADDNEEIESLNLQNIDKSLSAARTNCLKNIATAADMPAQLLENETMVAGFGEGTEDAKNIAKYVDRHREEMEPVYAFMDLVCMYRAWTPELFEALKAEFPEAYEGKTFEAEFQRWKNSFKAKWPSLLVEPDSEKAKAAKVKLEGVISALQNFGPMLDPEGKADLIMWAVDEINSIDFLFSSRLELDHQLLLAWCQREADRLDEMASMAQEQSQVEELEPARPKPALRGV